MFLVSKGEVKLGKYFGTDGIRGIANKELTPEIAYKVARISGSLFSKEDEKAKVLIGNDSRISAHMLEGALIAGFLSVGVEVMRLGVISTPGVAYLTKVMNAEMGVMISASHNPVGDNGIKIFGPNGYKLTDSEEERIEELMEEEDDLPRPTGSKIGAVNNYFEGSQKYLSYLKETVNNEFSDISIALDCANGATSSLAPHLFADLEAEIYTIGNNPTGLNINDGVGSTNPEKLQELVLEKEADIGLAFDGDGDRLIAVDENGKIVDGDQIMFILAKYLNEAGNLNKNTVVSTVMSNIGFYKALEENNIASVKTNVGDRYVMEEMRANGYNLGGEQSGHIILLDHSTGGDGMLSGIQLVNVMEETGKTLSELAGEMKVYPQVLKNVNVSDKNSILNNEILTKEIEKVESELGESGRVLVRPSGTESLVRVMVEAESKEICNEHANELASIIKEISK